MPKSKPTRVYAKNGKVSDQAIAALDCFDITDIMIGLAERRYEGVTTPLYEAVEEATEEIDEGSVIMITDKGSRRLR